jgi:hypothetical protein
MRNKRGQITLFIIIGIVVLFGVSAFLYVNQQVKKQNQPSVTEVQNIPADLGPIKEYVQNCVDELAKQGFISLGLQGGYIQPPKTYIEPPYAITIGNVNDKVSIPNLDEVKRQFQLYVKEVLQGCTAGFEPFLQQGFSVKEDTPISDLTFGNQTIIKIKYPLTISKEGTNTTLSDFVTSVPIRFRYIDEVAQNLSRLAIQNNGAVDLTYLDTLDLNVSVSSNEKGKSLYTLTDKKSSMDGEPYTFMFVIDIRP